MATIKDIAEQLKISIATVSRVLNNDTSMSVSKTTRKKIFQTADALGYTRHKKYLAAQKSSKKVAIIQWCAEEEEINDLYYYSIRIGIEKKAHELGYEIIRIYNDGPLENAANAEGIVAIGKYSNERIKEIEALNKKIIFVDSNTLHLGHSCIVTDYSNAVMSALDHFMAQGQTKIGMITGKELTKDHEFPEIDIRFDTFKNYLTYKGLYNPDYVAIGSFLVEDGYRMMTEMIKKGMDQLPEAFFFANDALAIGALRALHENDIHIPEQVSLISFNDTVVAKQVYPTLAALPSIQRRWASPLWTPFTST